MDFTEQAEDIVRLVRAYTTSHDEAVGLVVQALRAAQSGGEAQGFKEAADGMTQTLNRVVGVTGKFIEQPTSPASSTPKWDAMSDEERRACLFMGYDPDNPDVPLD